MGIIIPVIIILINSAICGIISQVINTNKGYSGGFAWGFLLGELGIIVIACKTDARVIEDLHSIRETVATIQKENVQQKEEQTAYIKVKESKTAEIAPEKTISVKTPMYAEGCPLVLYKCIMRQNTDSGMSTVIPVWENISEKSVKAAKIKLIAYDAFEEKCGVTEYQYLDLSVKQNETFGTNSVIRLEGKFAERLVPIVNTVIFTDGKAWRSQDGTELSTASEEMPAVLREQYEQDFAREAMYMVGNSVTFGAYEQDNDTTKNVKEVVEWIVLARENNKALLISKYVLDCKEYNQSKTDTTWEKCTLRSWLNSEFLNNAFSAEEQAQIETTTVSADENPSYSTNPGNATQDKVFLLSIPEAKKYFKTDEDRMCIPTAYAKAQGCYTSDSYKKNGQSTCRWWLRSPGGNQRGAASIYRSGSISDGGEFVNSGDCAVRPAMWVEIS